MRKTALIPAALIGLTALSAPAAHAAGGHAFNNQDNSVRCEYYAIDNGVTICVSDRARESQPECSPPEAKAPAVVIKDDFVGTNCWNQGQTTTPENLAPLSMRQYGTNLAFADLQGNIFVFDTQRFALIKAGSPNQVIFPGFGR